LTTNKIGLDEGFRFGFLGEKVVGKNEGRYCWNSVKKAAFVSQPSYRDK
jgi:hypothetical protein